MRIPYKLTLYRFHTDSVQAHSSLIPYGFRIGSLFADLDFLDDLCRNACGYDVRRNVADDDRACGDDGAARRW